MGWNHRWKRVNNPQFQGLLVTLANLLIEARRKKTPTIAAIDVVALCVQKKGFSLWGGASVFSSLEGLDGIYFLIFIMGRLWDGAYWNKKNKIGLY